MHARSNYSIVVERPPAPPDTAKLTAGWLMIFILSCSGVAIARENPAITPHTAYTQPQPPCPAANTALDLSAVVNLALCNNPQTQEMWANALAQSAQVGVTQAGYYPAISANASGNRTTPGNSARSLGLSLSYLLYDFGARAANLENARQLLVAANATQDNMVQTVFLAAVSAYYQMRATQAGYDASLISERAAQESAAAAQARYLAGSATPADKLAAKTAYSQAVLNRITAEGVMKIAQGNLANLLGLDANREVALVAAQSQPLSDGGMEQNIALLIEQARAQRPDLLAASANLKAAQAGTDAARAAGLPSLALTASTSQSNSAGLNTRGSSLGLNLSVPLFSGYAPSYRIRAAEAQVDARQAQLERIRLQIALDVWTAYQNLATATQNRHTTADLLTSAEQSERVALGRYQAGAGIMLDLLLAQTTLAGARQQRIQADLNWNIARATLAQSMGGLSSALLHPLSDKGMTDNTAQHTGNTP